MSTGAYRRGHRRRGADRAGDRDRAWPRRAASRKAQKVLRRLPARDAAGVDEVSVLRLGAGRAPRVHPRADGEPDAATSTEEVTTIGSVAGNTVVLADPAVSRKHAGIRKVDSDYELADLGSTNGVYVNGHKVPKKTLEPGDIIRVGNTEAVFKRE